MKIQDYIMDVERRFRNGTVSDVQCRASKLHSTDVCQLFELEPASVCDLQQLTSIICHHQLEFWFRFLDWAVSSFIPLPASSSRD